MDRGEVVVKQLGYRSRGLDPLVVLRTKAVVCRDERFPVLDALRGATDRRQSAVPLAVHLEQFTDRGGWQGIFQPDCLTFSNQNIEHIFFKISTLLSKCRWISANLRAVSISSKSARFCEIP